MKRNIAVWLGLLSCSGTVLAQTSSGSEPIAATVIRENGLSRAEVQAELLSAEKAGVLPMNDSNYPSAQLAHARGADVRSLTAPQTLARRTQQ